MATKLKFDEVNALRVDESTQGSEKTPKALPYREFFGKMHISVPQMRARMELAGGIEDVMLYVFAYWGIRAEMELSRADMVEMLAEQLRAVVGQNTRLDGYIEKHISKVAEEIIDTTEKHASGDDAKPYWTSQDRAMLISENEANSIYNYDEYRVAKANGYTKKRWLTENDEKVRLTHTLVENKTVDIDGLFLVGDSLMRFPHDMEYDPAPEEVINCRCACVYEP